MLRNRLDSLQKAFNIFDSSGSKSLEDAVMDEVGATAMQFESNVMDGPVVNSRAGLYIYLNALVSFPLSFVACSLLILPSTACGPAIGR